MTLQEIERLEKALRKQAAEQGKIETLREQIGEEDKAISALGKERRDLLGKIATERRLTKGQEFEREKFEFEKGKPSNTAGTLAQQIAARKTFEKGAGEKEKKKPKGLFAQFKAMDAAKLIEAMTDREELVGSDKVAGDRIYQLMKQAYRENFGGEPELQERFSEYFEQLPQKEEGQLQGLQNPGVPEEKWRQLSDQGKRIVIKRMGR